MHLKDITAALSRQMPPILRWAGAIAKRLRQFNIALEGKSSGSSNTDALTIADLTLQELIVAALRDGSPIFRSCRIEAEESTGDLHRFASESPWTIALDPIDGTKQYRDRTGQGYCVMLHLRNLETVHYSLVYIPEADAEGRWVEVIGDTIRCGPDDQSLPAREALDRIAPIDPAARPDSRKIYMIGFIDETQQKADLVTRAGLQGIPPDETPGSIYDLMSTGAFGGSLIHSPNVYDFPVSLQIARLLGGDAVWVHNRQPVHFEKTWMDTRADMLRLPGIVACSPNRQTLKTLCALAKDWNPNRYKD